ncbi:hypothetical protein [Actinokineospora sp.]|uniref:hypothetical protein n=1 Tax=Actinokineospora sp. TaxID=1872133 RepID=UPI004037D927
MNGKGSRGPRVVGGLLLGLALGVSVVGCTSVQRGEGRAPAGSTSSSVPATTITVTETATATAKPAGSRTPTTTKKITTTTTTSRGGGARIDSFTVVRKPTCPVVGTPDAPFSSPGQGVIIAWKVSGAEGAALAVDSPGVYGAYGSDHPVSGQLELSFPCNATPGTTSHTYTVWPKDAKTVAKTLTVTATNNA